MPEAERRFRKIGRTMDNSLVSLNMDGFKMFQHTSGGRPVSHDLPSSAHPPLQTISLGAPMHHWDRFVLHRLGPAPARAAGAVAGP